MNRDSEIEAAAQQERLNALERKIQQAREVLRTIPDATSLDEAKRLAASALFCLNAGGW